MGGNDALQLHELILTLTKAIELHKSEKLFFVPVSIRFKLIKLALLKRIIQKGN